MPSSLTWTGVLSRDLQTIYGEKGPDALTITIAHMLEALDFGYSPSGYSISQDELNSLGYYLTRISSNGEWGSSRSSYYGALLASFYNPDTAAGSYGVRVFLDNVIWMNITVPANQYAPIEIKIPQSAFT